MQWAAVTTWRQDTSVPPQKWPPFLVRTAAVHGHAPAAATVPPTMRSPTPQLDAGAVVAALPLVLVLTDASVVDVSHQKILLVSRGASRSKPSSSAPSPPPSALAWPSPVAA